MVIRRKFLDGVYLKFEVCGIKSKLFVRNKVLNKFKERLLLVGMIGLYNIF